jgi:hypothetical protein
VLAKNLPKVFHPEKIRGKFFRVGKKFTKSVPPRKNPRKIFSCWQKIYQKRSTQKKSAENFFTCWQKMAHQKKNHAGYLNGKNFYFYFSPIHSSQTATPLARRPNSHFKKPAMSELIATEATPLAVEQGLVPTAPNSPTGEYCTPTKISPEPMSLDTPATPTKRRLDPFPLSELRPVKRVLFNKGDDPFPTEEDTNKYYAQLVKPDPYTEVDRMELKNPFSHYIRTFCLKPETFSEYRADAVILNVDFGTPKNFDHHAYTGFLEMLPFVNAHVLHFNRMRLPMPYSNTILNEGENGLFGYKMTMRMTPIECEAHNDLEEDDSPSRFFDLTAWAPFRTAIYPWATSYHFYKETGYVMLKDCPQKEDDDEQYNFEPQFTFHCAGSSFEGTFSELPDTKEIQLEMKLNLHRHVFDMRTVTSHLDLVATVNVVTGDCTVNNLPKTGSVHRTPHVSFEEPNTGLRVRKCSYTIFYSNDLVFNFTLSFIREEI